MFLFGCLSFPYIIVKNVSEQNLIMIIIIIHWDCCKNNLENRRILEDLLPRNYFYIVTSFNLIERLNLCSSESCHIFLQNQIWKNFYVYIGFSPQCKCVFFINGIVYVLHDLVLFLLYVFYASCCLLEGFLPFDKNFGRVVRE